eukprot:1190864-Prorocentrum_minimum.AAC.3
MEDAIQKNEVVVEDQSDYGEDPPIYAYTLEHGNKTTNYNKVQVHFVIVKAKHAATIIAQFRKIQRKKPGPKTGIG